MKVKELRESKKSEYVEMEVYRYNSDKYQRLLTDYIRSLDDKVAIADLDECEVESYWLMNEEEYDNTILANNSIRADFEMWYGDHNAKVLVVIIRAYELYEFVDYVINNLKIENDDKNMWVDIGSNDYCRIHASISIEEVLDEDDQELDVREILWEDIKHPAWQLLYWSYKEQFDYLYFV